MSAQRILVVDDETHIVHVVSLKLRNAGFDVQTASDGEEAYQIALQQPPDLLITDFQMPYMDGLQLCAALKKNPSTAKVPALMLTARGHALPPEDLAATNIKNVLSKPFSPRHVLEEVQRMLVDSTHAAGDDERTERYAA